MGLTVNRQMAQNLTVNRQKRNIFTVNRQMSEPKLAVKFLRPRPHVSGYFWIRNFFFPDTAIVHTHTANSQANPEIFESALQSGNFWIR